MDAAKLAVMACRHLARRVASDVNLYNYFDGPTLRMLNAAAVAVHGSAIRRSANPGAFVGELKRVRNERDDAKAELKRLRQELEQKKTQLDKAQAKIRRKDETTPVLDELLQYCELSGVDPTVLDELLQYCELSGVDPTVEGVRMAIAGKPLYVILATT